MHTYSVTNHVHERYTLYSNKRDFLWDFMGMVTCFYTADIIKLRHAPHVEYTKVYQKIDQLCLQTRNVKRYGRKTHQDLLVALERSNYIQICHHGGQRILIPSISKILSLMWYHCIQYTKRQYMNLISPIWHDFHRCWLI